MKIRLLGTGTPTPSLKRKSSGYLIEVDKDVIIFDCGPGSYHRMLEAGIKPTQVTNLFLTHLHYDHCLDYATLMLTRWDQGADLVDELNIYGPSPIRKITEQLIGRNGAFSPDIQARIKHQGSIDIFEARGGTTPRRWPKPNVKELEPDSTVENKNWRIKTCEVNHVQPYLKCFAYRLETKEGSFVYSGDSGPCEELVKLANNCDVLVHMCHYISGTEPTDEYAKVCGGHLEVAETARKANAKTLVTSHMLNQMDVPGVKERIINEMGEIYKGNIIWGEDLMEIPLRPALPDKLD
jgi:ribonuclease Z